MHREINIFFEVILGKSKTTNINLSNLHISEDSLIYDFGNLSSYFCIVSDKRDTLKDLSYHLSDYLNDTYLFVYLYAEPSQSLCIGISNRWLQNHLSDNFKLQENYIGDTIRKVLSNFSSSYSVVASRHLIFQKQLTISAFKSLFLQSYCSQFIHTFLMDINLELKQDKPSSFKSIEIKRVMDIEQKIVNNLPKSSPTIKEMADMAGMSISKFKILFQEAFGESPHQHILEKKLVLAKELLKTGQYSIAQVSYKIGFNHPSGFTRLFKNKFQYPPSVMYNNTLISKD